MSWQMVNKVVRPADSLGRSAGIRNAGIPPRYMEHGVSKFSGSLQTLQRSSVDTSKIDNVPTIVDEILHSPGQPLDGATRSYMEPRFGHDFSRVRIHADSKAAESAQAVNARAYTVGNDVVFNGGQYSPGTLEGVRLIGHELMHVAQQNTITPIHGKLQPKLVVQKPKRRPPNAPEWVDNASIINGYVSKLCSGFRVSTSGEVEPPSDAFCATAATTSTPESCKCLCFMTDLPKTWKIYVSDTRWPETEDKKRRIFVQSPYSGLTYGAWSGGLHPQRINYSNWLLFAHELCGHAWLIAQRLHPRYAELAGARTSHDPTIEIENKIADEHGIPESQRRGQYFTSLGHSGESFTSVVITSYPSGGHDVTATPPQEQAKLDVARNFMKKSSSIKADVLGYTDQAESNKASVSLQRAEKVRDALIGGRIRANRFMATKGKSDTGCAIPGDQSLCRKVAIHMFMFPAASESRGVI